MTGFPKIALRGVSSALVTAVAAAWLLLPGGLSAQTVNVSAGGIISLGGVPPIYNGQYVIQKTDFGFLWLDTVALQGGLVQVEAKCGTGQPPSAVGIYVIGDCNGITNVSSSGNIVLARQLSGQCGAATDGCGGPRDADGGTGMFAFTLGTWAYQGRTNTDIPDSTQTADLQGRTWKATANSLSSFTWTATGGNTPPIAGATASNLSAANRTDKANYYGDKWQLQDASSSGPPITNVDWDLNYNGTYARDEGGPPSTEGTITGYFPCDPSGPISGNIRTGANCIQSLNLTNPATAGNYRFAEQSANANGTSANVFTSSPASVVCPQPKILGFTGFTGTCAKTGGTLNVLVGGNADASGSQGNLAEASFAWTFTGPNPISASSAVVAVPAGDTGFTLTITYPGGYQATASGTVVQSSLVAAFALSPNPVLINTPITLTNQMQIASGTTLASVNYVINPATTPGTCDSTFNGFTGAPTLGNSFLAGGGTTTVTAPATNGGFCVYLKYNYTPSGSSTQQSQIVSNPFSATDWVAAPQIAISPVPFCLSGPCQLSTGTAYSLSDSENIPLSTHPGATWFLNTNQIGTSADANAPITWTPTSTCSSCTLKVTVNGSSATLPVTISLASPPTPVPTPGPTPPPGGGGLSVSVSGPASGSKGTPLTYSATASGGSPPYSYQWQCDYNPLGAFTQQGPTATCAYAASGSHNVKALVRDSAAGSALSPDFNVTITGPPPPSSTYTVTGSGLGQNVFNGRYNAPNGTAITFSASETLASTYNWNFGDGTPPASTKTAVHTFPSSGPYAVVLTVQGDGINNSGTASATINLDITGPPRPSTSYTITGAKQTGTDTYTAESGLAITFTANATLASAFSWDFGDETKPGRTVTKSYPSVGPRTVRLTVTGDGTNTAGTAFVDIAMNITPPTFRAAIVPGVAHLDDGTTTWGSDVSITNSGTSPMNISLAFVPLASDAPASLDLTQLNYASAVPLGPGASYSVSDVVTALNGGNNKGTLVVQYKGGSRAPLVTARVYFQPKVNPKNISYGSGIPAYEVDSSGRISAQGFVSTALSQTPDGATADSVAEALDYGLTVTLTGTGTGTVTSDPAGINCPTTCSATFPVGTFVNLSGSAAAGSTFAGITGCDFYSLGTCTVTMSGQKSVTAKFDGGGSTPPPASSPTLTVSKTGMGSGTVSSSPSGINCGSTCSAQFSQGTAVTLSAAPSSNSTFTGWGGACSGTGSCVVTLSNDASVTAGFSPASAAAPQGDQVLIGLVSDPSYRFVVTLFNASGTSGNFELKALDDQGSTVLILDETGNRAASRKFANLAPYQQVYLKDADLGLEQGRHYVLKATATQGTLLAFGTALDRKTNDLVQITDDSQAAPVENGLVSYWVAGVSRIDSYAHWRTDLRIFNRGSKTRNLSFQYSYTSDGITEHIAEVANRPIAAGQLLNFDDVIATLMALDTRVDLSGNTAGILRIFYAEDDESATRPLVIGSRNYDNEPTGTAGSQLSVYTLGQAAGAGQKLVLAGAEESDRYTSRIGVFAVDAGPITGRIVAVGPDGTEVGSLNFGVGGSGPHYGQISLTDPSLNFQNPGTPVSIRIDQLSGGRVGAYVFTVDKVTLDTNFIQALPQN